MDNLETVWCSSSYIRPLDCSIETERRSILAESVLETDYKVLSANELDGIPLSGNEKAFAEQHLWSIPVEKARGSQYQASPIDKHNLSKVQYLNVDNSDNPSLFFNNWGRVGKFMLFLYITFLSILQDITGIVIPNSLYKTELIGSDLQVVTEIPCISPLYPLYWKYILKPTRYMISLVIYLIWRVELASMREYSENGNGEDEMVQDKAKEEMTWIPGTLDLVNIINTPDNKYSGFSIFSKPLENVIRNSRGIRSFAREHRILGNTSNNNVSDGKIKHIAVRPIGNVIAIGYSSSFSIWEYKISLLRSGGTPALNGLTSSSNANFRSSIDVLNRNGEWKLVYYVNLFKLGSLAWSSDGSKLYVGDGSSIREFNYIYLFTQDSKKLGYQHNSDFFINNGRVVAKGPTIAHDCVSIAVSDIYSLVGTVWEGGYFRVYDTCNWEYLTVCHKFSLRPNTFLPKVICVDDKASDLSSFIFTDSESVYELLINDQNKIQISSNSNGSSFKTINNNTSNISLLQSKYETRISSKIRLRELPIHSRNREKTISDFCVSFRRMAIVYKESNMVWLYCYLMNTLKNSKLMLIGVIQDFGIPKRLAMQTINENNYLVSGTLLSVKWKSSCSNMTGNCITRDSDIDSTIKTYPLFHYNNP